MSAHCEIPRSRFRFVMLVGIGVIGGVLALAVIVALTPPDDIDPRSAAISPRPLRRAGVSLPSTPVDATIEELQFEARQVAETVTAQFPDSAEAHRIAALLYQALRQTDDAAKYWQKSLELAPADARPHVGLALVYLDQGRDRDAVEVLEAALAARCWSPDLFTTLATALNRLGEFDRSADVLQEGLAVFPRSHKAWLLLGQTQIQQSQPERAKASLVKAVEFNGKSTDAYYALSSVCVRLGDRQAALDHRKRFAELKARDREMDDRLALVADLDMVRQRTAATLCGAGTVCLRNGNSDEAERLLLRAAAIAPGLPESYKALASLYQAQGRISDAVTVQKRLVQLDPDSIINHVNLANLTLRGGNALLAEEILRNVIVAHPESAMAFSCLAKICIETGRPSEARGLAQESIARESTRAGYLVLAEACRQLNDASGLENATRELRRLDSEAQSQSSFTLQRTDLN